MIFNILVLLLPVLSPCKNTIHLRIDNEFTKREVKVIKWALTSWTNASNKQLCFTTEMAEISPIEMLGFDRDNVSTIYSGKSLWQKAIIISRFDCTERNHCLAITTKSHGSKPYHDIFIRKMYNLYTLMVHELGHVFGLDHSNKRKDVMYHTIRMKGRGTYISYKDKKMLLCLIKSKQLREWQANCSY